MSQVLEIIKNRHHGGSKPGERADPYKVALCVEGGGLRGVVSGGSLAALEALNLKDAFDVVYGASCGAYCSSYFVSGKTMVGSRFFLDHSQRQFISIKRFLTGGPIFDLDYVERMMHSVTPLNYHKALKANPPLHIVATDAKRSRPHTLKDFKTPNEIDRALKASSNVPSYFHPRPLIFRSRNFLDASILDPFCIHSAVAEQCTHMLILFSMPWRHRHVFRLLDKSFIAPMLAKINDVLAEIYLEHGEYSVNGLNHIWNHYDGTHILTVAPRKSRKLPGQLTRDRQRLGFGFLAGAEAVLNHFAPDDHTKELILASFKNELRI
ncbi:TPA: hypothetical protein DIS56_02915 [Candidatus Saccharibacteria bacterium]|nr:MAG: hypothetical protein A3F05_01820 [Candidatus Saccharibacteria bacterium RIFCSPHIGHO2_12_FULL_47_17]HCM52058.1 hypothetical protein [Candidatus Saccharibacteria bacterium]